MTERIAAIVVSTNRLDETKACIAALRAQERPVDGIIVVDNGSTDGSKEWLDAQTDLRVIHQENLGTSGGMRTGLGDAMARGFDWMWLFDEDAHPTPGALQALCRAMEKRPKARVCNSVSLSRTDPSHFAVGALQVRTNPDNYLAGLKTETLAEAEKYVDALGMVDSIGGHFYHGVLVHRTVVETVGTPLPWLFMCGEETEYGLRMMRAGYHIYVVMDSVVFHPEIPFAPMNLFGRRKAFEIRGPQRRYLFIRNGMWIHRTYFQGYPLMRYAARRLGGALLAELFVIPNRSWRERLAACGAALRGVFDGLRLQPARDREGREILA